MRQAGQVARDALNSSATTSEKASQASPKSRPGANRNLARMIWAGLEVTYKSRWSARFADTAAIDEWMSVWSYALADLSEQEVREALARAARECEWPPASPAEFRALIMPAGMPDLAQVVALICRNEPRPEGVSFEDWWVHPIVLAVATDSSLDLFNVRLMSASKARSIIEPILDKHVKKMIRGRVYVFPVERAALQQKEEKPKVTAAGKAARDEFMKIARQVLSNDDKKE